MHATMIRTADGLRDELTEHLVHGVQVATVRNMAAIGVTDFVEVGPGRVLTGLVKRISPESNAHALDEADDGWLPEPAPLPAPKRASASRDSKRPPGHGHRLGVVSPVGIGNDTAWENLVAGRSGIREVTIADLSDQEIKVGGEVPDFDLTVEMDPKDVRRMTGHPDGGRRDGGSAPRRGPHQRQQPDLPRRPIRTASAWSSLWLRRGYILLENAKKYWDVGPNRVSPWTIPYMLVDSPSGMVAIQPGIRGLNTAVGARARDGEPRHR